MIEKQYRIIQNHQAETRRHAEEQRRIRQAGDTRSNHDSPIVTWIRDHIVRQDDNKQKDNTHTERQFGHQV